MKKLKLVQSGGWSPTVVAFDIEASRADSLKFMTFFAEMQQVKPTVCYDFTEYDFCLYDEKGKFEFHFNEYDAPAKLLDFIDDLKASFIDKQSRSLTPKDIE